MVNRNAMFATMSILYNKDYVQVIDLHSKKKDTPIINKTEIEVTVIIHSLVRNGDSMIIIKEIPHINILEGALQTMQTALKCQIFRSRQKQKHV